MSQSFVVSRCYAADRASGGVLLGGALVVPDHPAIVGRLKSDLGRRIVIIHGWGSFCLYESKTRRGAVY